MKTLSIVFLLLFACSAWAQSQEIKKPIPPIPSEAKRADKPQYNAEPKQSDASNFPASINLNIGGKLEIEGKYRNGEADTETNKWTDPLSIFTCMLVIVTAVLAVFTYLLWDSGTRAAALQATDMKTSLGIAQQSADAATRAANAALLSAKNMQSADRAYIKISHKPPGLIFNDSHAVVMYGTVRTGNVTVEVSNLGKTPARITAFVMTYFTLSQGEPLPPLPPYDRGHPERPEVRTTMYGTDAMIPNFKINLSIDEFTTINARTSRLYLLIYADYIDQFEVRHRAGYARRYDPDSSNNLVLVTQRDYNYDIQRQPDQGDDWNDPI